MIQTSEQKPAPVTGRARSKPTPVGADAGGFSPAGKTSARLNNPINSGRTLAGGKRIVSECSNVIKGTSAIPGDNHFVQFHIKRRILPNSKQGVIVPLGEPTTPNTARAAAGRSSGGLTERATINSNNNPISRSGDSSPSSKIIKENNSKTNENNHLSIGGKTFDTRDKRMKKPVERPVQRETKPRPLLEKPSQAASVLPGPNFGAGSARSSSAPAPVTYRAGKHIPKQGVAKQDDDSVKRFTRPPFWDEQARPPPGHEYALPTRNFKIPRVANAPTKSSQLKQLAPSSSASTGRASSVGAASNRSASVCSNVSTSSAAPVPNAALTARPHRQQRASSAANNNNNVSTGRRRSSSVSSNDSSNLNYMFSPNRLIARKKNESVVDECIGGRINAQAPLKKTILDHDGHNSKGWLDVNGKIRTRTQKPFEYQVYAPTLSNNETNVFRYHPERDSRGKSMFGHERKTKSNEALQYGANFEGKSADVRELREHPVGKAYHRSVRASSAPAPSATEGFKRSSTTSSLEAPFDCSTNPGKYDITYESRTTCRPWKPYVRPVLKKAF